MKICGSHTQNSNESVAEKARTTLPLWFPVLHSVVHACHVAGYARAKGGLEYRVQVQGFSGSGLVQGLGSGFGFRRPGLEVGG